MKFERRMCCGHRNGLPDSLFMIACAFLSVSLDADALINQLPGDSPTAASYEFTNEDHTLGNALRYIIMKK